MRKNPALRVEQVHLDAGVDHHEHVEHVAQRSRVDSLVLQKRVFGDHVLRQLAVEFLADFHLVHLGREQSQAHEHDAEQQEQQEQSDNQLAVQSAVHSSDFRGFAELVAYTPDGQDVAGLRRVNFDFGAQPVDVRVYGVFVTGMLITPHAVE